MLHHRPATVDESKKAPAALAVAIAEMLSIADDNSLTEVSIHLNNALIALGKPGVPIDAPWAACVMEVMQSGTLID